MRKNYLYAITIVVLCLFVWFGYYLYTELRPVEYQNGTFVEVPGKPVENEVELSA